MSLGSLTAWPDKGEVQRLGLRDALVARVSPLWSLFVPAIFFCPNDWLGSYLEPEVLFLMLQKAPTLEDHSLGKS